MLSFSPSGKREGRKSGEVAPPPITNAQHELRAQEDLLDQEAEVRQDQLEHLAVEDPTRFEEMLQEDDLDDEDEPTDD